MALESIVQERTLLVERREPLLAVPTRVRARRLDEHMVGFTQEGVERKGVVYRNLFSKRTDRVTKS